MFIKIGDLRLKIGSISSYRKLDNPTDQVKYKFGIEVVTSRKTHTLYFGKLEDRDQKLEELDSLLIKIKQ